MDLAAYATANLPRYTSYPTAPHFVPLAAEFEINRMREFGV